MAVQNQVKKSYQLNNTQFICIGGQRGTNLNLYLYIAPFL